MSPKLKNTSFIANTLRLLFGIATAQAINLLTIPIITRLYSPDSYGTLTLFLSISLIITEISCLRLETVILLPQKNKDAFNVFIICIIFVLVFSFFISIVSLVINNTSFHLPESYKSLTPYLYLMAVYILVAGTYKALSFFTIRRNHFSIQALSRVGDAGGNKLFSVLYALVLMDNPIGLIGGLIFGHIISCLLIIKHSLKELFYSLRFVDINSLVGIFKRYKSFAIYSGTALLECFSREMLTLLFGVFFNPLIVGFIGLSRRVIQQPLGILGDAISRSFFQKISETHRDSSHYDHYVFDLYKHILIISFIPILLFSVIAPNLFEFVFGGHWRTAGFYFSILSPSFYSGFLYKPFSIIFDVQEKQRLRFLLSILRSMLNFTAIYCGVYIFNSPTYAMILYSAVHTIITFGMMFFLMNLAGVSFRSSFAVILNQILIGTLLVLPILYVNLYSDSTPTEIFVTVGLLILGYLIFILKQEPKLKRQLIILIEKIKM